MLPDVVITFMKKIRSRWKRISLAVVFCAAAPVVVLVWLLYFAPRPVTRLELPESAQAYDHKGMLLCAFLNDQDQWLLERPLDKISPYLAQATIAAEDQRFLQHRGIDLIAVLRAAWHTITKCTVLRSRPSVGMPTRRLASSPTTSAISRKATIWLYH